MPKTKTPKTNLHQLSKAELIDRIIALELLVARLSKDSTNSSKPSSTDFHNPDKPTGHSRNSRQPSGKPSGGQPGHPGSTRISVSDPDEIVPCAPEQCSGCGNDLTNPACQASIAVAGTAQIVDLPPIVPIVTEYQRLAVTCQCGRITEGQYPAGVVAGSCQLGPNISSFLVYLNTAHHLPYQRLAGLARDLLNLPVSQGTIQNKLAQAAKTAEPAAAAILNFLRTSSWAGSDETGAKVAGQRWWQWVWQNAQASYYAIAPSRGYKIIKQYFGESFTGTLVHDCLGAQNMTAAGFHQLCHAHLFRDCQFLIGTKGEAAGWAYRLRRLLYKSQLARDHCWREGFDPWLRRQVIRSYQNRLMALLREDIAGQESRKLQKRLVKHRDKLLHFMNSPDIPPDNNGSERAIRNAKVKQKVSGGFRSEDGAKYHATLLSVIETAKKQDRPVLGIIQRLMRGEGVELFGAE